MLLFFLLNLHFHQFCPSEAFLRWGNKYWNNLYHDQGVSYEEWDGFWNYYSNYGYKRPYGTFSNHFNNYCKYSTSYLNCTHSPKSLNIVNKAGIKGIPKNGLPSNIEELNIQDTGLEYIHPNAFSKLTGLKKLTIIRSKLKEVPNLADCVHLEELDLYDNNIQIFRHNFTRLPKSLTKIILIKNQIDKIPTDYFDLPKLKYLALSLNRMRYFPGSAFRNPQKLMYLGVDANLITTLTLIDIQQISYNKSSLMHLNVSNNYINYTAPKMMKELWHLKILELHNNNIEDILVNVFSEIPELLHLDLVRNKIKRLTSRAVESCPKLITLLLHSQKDGFQMETVYFDSLQNLKNLKNLWLSNNNLKHFPHPLLFEDGWDSLSNLYVDHNQIKSLRDYSIEDFPMAALGYHGYQMRIFKPFKKTPSLQVLQSSYNNIAVISKGDLEYCSQLAFLDLSGNYLQDHHIHKYAFQNTSLEELVLSSQRGIGIQYIPSAVMNNQSLHFIQTIVLSFNHITFIQTGCFVHLNTLQKLVLNNNAIIAIEDDCFPPKIQYITLSSNEFSFKNVHQFKGLNNLTSLLLDRNRIKIIPDDAFHGLGKLRYLHLSYNHIGRILKVHFKDFQCLYQVKLDNNFIAFVEHGTFSVIPPDKFVYQIDLSFNNISDIPISDFWNLRVKYLNLKNNRITKVPTKAFVNITDCAIIELSNNKIDRVQSYGFLNVVCDEKVESKILLGGHKSNHLKVIEPHAFSGISCHTLDLSYHEIKTIPSFAFTINKCRKNLNLNDGQLTTINENAFHSIEYTENLNLMRNNIQIIQKKIFVSPSTIKNLNLHHNNLQALHDDAFVGVSITGSLQLNNNKILSFPRRTLRNLPLVTNINLERNLITSLSVGSLDVFVSVEYMDFSYNNIQKLAHRLFFFNKKLKKINLQYNNIQIIEENTFLIEPSSDIEIIYLQYNPIQHIPVLGNLLNLKEIYFTNITTIDESAFVGLTKLELIDLDSNNLQCDCYLFDSLYSFMMAEPGSNEIRNAKCESPMSVAGMNINRLSKDEMISKIHEFICTPTDLNVTALENETIQVSYLLPNISYSHPNGTIIPDNSSLFYITAVCETVGYPKLQETVLGRYTIWMTGADQVIPGHDYKCYLFTTVLRSGANVSSARTKYIFVTTRERESKASQCSDKDPYECNVLVVYSTCVKDCDVNASEALNPGSCSIDCCFSCYRDCFKCDSVATGRIGLDIRYYDFPITDMEFSNVYYEQDKYRKPRYMVSPYETWLAISAHPTTDGYSDWFRSTSSRNIAVNSNIVLVNHNDKDPLNEATIYKFSSDSFWPIDGKGFGSQGQKNCFTNELQNKGFTSALRTVFTYHGNEHLTFGGGDEMWVYINKVLVLELHQQPDNSSQICGSIHLNETGNWYLTPLVGIIENNTCKVRYEDVQQTVYMTDLKIDMNVGLDIFHTQHFGCLSTYLLETSAVTFVNVLEQQTTKPLIDYEILVHENIHVNSNLTQFPIADEFSLGPFNVSIVSGNEEDTFLLKESSPDAYNISLGNGSKSHETTIDLDGETIVLCTHNINVTTPILHPGSQALLGIVNNHIMLVLKKNFDYESTKSYLLKINVRDTGLNLNGNITVKVVIIDVNDNCPVLPNKNYSIRPSPPLQLSPLLKITAHDIDSNENGEIFYKVSDIKQQWFKRIHVPFTVTNGENKTQAIWINKTVEVSNLVYIFALDNGNPRRGDFIAFNITYSTTCQQYGKVIVDELSGDVYFRAPKMTNSTYDHSECVGCKAGYYCPGDGRELRCGYDEDTKHLFSFGAASECSVCPQGWLCHKGMIEKCPPDTYATCSKTFCPEQCFPCPSGSHCYEGKIYDCSPGSYSNGIGGCIACRPGSYNNVSKASSCMCCPPGYESTNMKTSCKPCRKNEYSTGNCEICKTCPSDGRCACKEDTCFKGVLCRNAGLGVSKCESCPVGYTGNGTSCADTNECNEMPCFHLSKCINLEPGFRCTGCPPGYTGISISGIGNEFARNNKQKCTDIDECKMNNKCVPNSQCINTMGSYYCGKCDPGYVGNGISTCHFGDSCQLGRNDCHANASCIALSAGRYHCQCKDGYAGDGRHCQIDSDYDAVSDKKDNCVFVPNGGQEDFDDDNIGDVCDVDDDNDNVLDALDNCQFFASHNHSDFDGDEIGDVCDNCQLSRNWNQANIDDDEFGDACDDDVDGDGILNKDDNCLLVPNVNQTDSDNDKIGDVCDNCPNFTSTSQVDDNMNGYGDVCETYDTDGDSVIDRYDNCPNVPNADQSDVDSDGKGDVCDEDSDNDGIADEKDNCVFIANGGQEHEQYNHDLQSNPIGDACSTDFDGDSIPDQFDACPFIHNIHSTSFERNMLVDLSYMATDGRLPKWRVTNKGRDVEQLVNSSRPSMIVGEQKYGDIDFSGVIHVNEKSKMGHYIGFVFGYQSNKKFYLVLWRRYNQNYKNSGGIKGVQIKVVNSVHGPSASFEQALWHSADSKDEVKLLWHDPEMKPWLHGVSYIFKLEFKPSLGRIWLLIKRGLDVITDSGYIYDTTIAGGRVGLFTFGQGNVIWSRLDVRCRQRVNKALEFNGNNSYVILPSLQTFYITSSFTLSVWLKLITGHEQSVLPIICTADQTLCLYIDKSMVHGTVGYNVIKDSTVLVVETWHHLAMRYDAQEHVMQLFLNGSSVAWKRDVIPHIWLSKTLVYLGTDSTSFFKGVLDEIAIWKVCLSDLDIARYMKITGLSWAKHQKLIVAHYNMDEAVTSTLLYDDSGHNNTGQIKDCEWVQSYLDKSRFQLTYPNNKRRNKSLLNHTEL